MLSIASHRSWVCSGFQNPRRSSIESTATILPFILHVGGCLCISTRLFVTHCVLHPCCSAAAQPRTGCLLGAERRFPPAAEKYLYLIYIGLALLMTFCTLITHAMITKDVFVDISRNLLCCLAPLETRHVFSSCAHIVGTYVLDAAHGLHVILALQTTSLCSTNLCMATS